MTIARRIFSSLRRPQGKKSAHFELRYSPQSGGDHVTVGHLAYVDGSWTFAYASDYKSRRLEFRPIEGFRDLDKTYTSKHLFPFFAVRIPDEHRPDVRHRLEEDDIRNPETTDMLRIFGRRVVSSPAFELIETA